MSELNASNLRKEHGNEGPDLVGTTELTSPYFMVPPSGNTAERPQNPQKGTLRFNTDIGSLEYFKGNTIGWEQIVRTTPNLDGGARAVISIGQASSPVGYNNIIEYSTIPTLGNATDFGDAGVTRDKLGAGASRTRGIFVGGEGGGNVIEYVTISSTGNAVNFGDIGHGAEMRFSSAASDSTRTFFGGGYTSSTLYDTIEYLTTASTGNGVDFGNMTGGKNGPAALSSSTRGIFAGGSPAAGWGSDTNVINYITISTTGNAADFGDLSVARSRVQGCSNSTRGLVMGGVTPSMSDVIDYITTATLGNAVDFGNLGAANYQPAACSSSTRGVIGGGQVGPAYVNTIEYITISTLSNSTDFGDLTVARRGLSSCSNSTRGLFWVGLSNTNTIEYITIATTGNATDFGDTTYTTQEAAACASVTRGIVGGGNPNVNTINYVEIATTGNATDFGDLSQARKRLGSCSNAHGGL